MADAASVHSQAAIERFRTSLIKLSDICRSAVDDLNIEVRRASDWLDHDRPAHWKEQVRLRERAVHDAKLALERCLIFRVADERPSCQEERVALRKAQNRFIVAKEKVEQVRKWRREVQHEQLEMQGRLGQVERLVEWEIPAAVAVLDQILDRLDAYTTTRTVGGGIRKPWSADSSAEAKPANDGKPGESTA